MEAELRNEPEKPELGELRRAITAASLVKWEYGEEAFHKLSAVFNQLPKEDKFEIWCRTSLDCGRKSNPKLLNFFRFPETEAFDEAGLDDALSFEIARSCMDSKFTEAARLLMEKGAPKHWDDERWIRFHQRKTNPEFVNSFARNFAKRKGLDESLRIALLVGDNPSDLQTALFKAVVGEIRPSEIASSETIRNMPDKLRSKFLCSPFKQPAKSEPKPPELAGNSDLVISSLMKLEPIQTQAHIVAEALCSNGFLVPKSFESIEIDVLNAAARSSTMKKRIGRMDFDSYSWLSQRIRNEAFCNSFMAQCATKGRTEAIQSVIESALHSTTEIPLHTTLIAIKYGLDRGLLKIVQDSIKLVHLRRSELIPDFKKAVSKKEAAKGFSYDAIWNDQNGTRGKPVFLFPTPLHLERFSKSYDYVLRDVLEAALPMSETPKKTVKI